MKIIIVPDPGEAGIAVANGMRDHLLAKAIMLPEDISIGAMPARPSEPTVEQRYLLKARTKTLSDEVARLGALIQAMHPDIAPNTVAQT